MVDFYFRMGLDYRDVVRLFIDCLDCIMYITLRIQDCTILFMLPDLSLDDIV
ncbi:hypothetical protein M6B38_337180 [Iris pallida]|uniref:Uncharacterized protein n=1 Tax=Iris pallida TaxID=29817 RepID=A0AAX6GZM9_IRIPA|nr:hypothetical protein M6B38_337180 [Iris pallida]